MSIMERVSGIVAPILDRLGLHLYDVEVNGATLRVTVEGDEPVDLDQLTSATHAIAAILEEEDPMPKSYTLEVSSPGLERKLRTPDHFAGAVGDLVSLKLGPKAEGERHLRGVLIASTKNGLTVIDDAGRKHVIVPTDVTKARTVFEWSKAPKPGQSGTTTKRFTPAGFSKNVDAEGRVSAG